MWVSADVLFPDDDFTPDPDLYEQPRPRSMAALYPDWHLYALCSGMDTEVFFGTDDTDVRPTISVLAIDRAKRVCDACPVFGQCLEWALTKREEYGVWAGTSGRTRERIWRLVDNQEVTVDQVVNHYLSGNSILYERRRSFVVEVVA